MKNRYILMILALCGTAAFTFSAIQRRMIALSVTIHPKKTIKNRTAQNLNK